MDEPDSLDAVERAHLVDPRDTSHRIGRWGPAADLAPLVRRYWVPTWSVPAGQAAEQQVLQYPVCLVVVADSYARFYGVQPGLSRTTLRGDGWAVGVMLQPAAGALLTGGSVAPWTGRHAPLADALSATAPSHDVDALVSGVREDMAPAPTDPGRQRAATDRVGAFLRRYLPVDEEGLLVNAVVAAVEEDPDVRRVSQLCERFATTERTLQRLTRRRLGLSPKWLVQRRRLHEAAERLREHRTPLADLAADLGYADESHLSRDFRRVTGMTPGAFAARFSPADARDGARG
ncbi:helix-turn-helix domain-containing protein [Cellulomonas wangsupingiae]|uniref:AraC family transcriptional regulator n=1 Tax=Cellulomonas wangsupingiae TaxID=2968085 RepID=A0ABY5K2E1_9CELL|nr:AraC family transcriptional regulator [Cellulomonas wangsupingiae]MCC2335447.1 AraC family transcriptional regulator [Cellulomonas wangsupingiae]UUI64379.1 AraC family transcriptional regulator [Cellulomonas wangsupingiae]